MAALSIPRLIPHLSPFQATKMIKEMVETQLVELKRLWKRKRQLTFQALNLAMIVCSALMLWKALMVITKSSSPAVVVLSGSMEPAFQKGDILFLDNTKSHVAVGDIVVFEIQGRDIPIVHRVLKVHEKCDGQVQLLTKGDANKFDDKYLYASGQQWITRDDILGKVIGVVRHVGMVTILLNEYPKVKYALVGMMGLFTLTSKEA